MAAAGGKLKAIPVTRSRDRELLRQLAELEPNKQGDILVQLGEDKALRDVGAELTIDRVRDVLEYAPTAKLAQQIRDALAHILERVTRNTYVSRSRAADVPPRASRKRARDR